jgi:hypothetical protein
MALNGLWSSIEFSLGHKTIEVNLSVGMKFIINRSRPVIGSS